MRVRTSSLWEQLTRAYLMAAYLEIVNMVWKSSAVIFALACRSCTKLSWISYNRTVSDMLHLTLTELRWRQLNLPCWPPRWRVSFHFAWSSLSTCDTLPKTARWLQLSHSVVMAVQQLGARSNYHPSVRLRVELCETLSPHVCYLPRTMICP